MKIYIAADHAGFELKKTLIAHLRSNGHEVEDMGAHKLDPGDDYPDFIYPCAKKVGETTGAMGIVVGGSGQAEAIVANKAKGVRAALFYGPVRAQEAVDVTGRKSSDPYEIIRLARLHNNANILALGARFITPEEAKKAVTTWLEAEFEGGRHERRIEKIAKIEEG